MGYCEHTLQVISVLRKNDMQEWEHSGGTW
jgi:hypothetical protein